jgi:hypothetical protein
VKEKAAALVHAELEHETERNEKSQKEQRVVIGDQHLLDLTEI